MKMRGRKRLAMSRAVPVFSGMLRYGIRAPLKRVRGGFTYAEPLVFPPPADTWGTVTHGLLWLPREVRVRGHGLARLRKRLQGLAGRLVIVDG